jgi:hypothetical protein
VEPRKTKAGGGGELIRLIPDDRNRPGYALTLAQQKTGDRRVDLETARVEARGKEPWKRGRDPADRAPPVSQRRPDHQLLYATQVVGLKKTRRIQGEGGEPREDTAAGPSDEVDRTKDCQG